MKQLFAIILFYVPVFVQPCLGQQKTLDSIYNLGIDKTIAGDVPGATALLVEATRLAEAENNQQVLCNIHVTMGKLGILSENNEAAATAIDLAESTCTACKDTLSLAKIFMQKGILQVKLNQYDKAISTFKNSADYYLFLGDSLGALNAVAKIGNVLEIEGKYTEARPYYLQFYNFARKNDFESVQYLTANIYLCGNCLYLKEFEKAQFHNNEIMRLSKKNDFKFEFAQALRYDAKIYYGLGRYKDAYAKLDYFTRYYQDTLMNAESLRQSEELKAKYEAEKKETLIALQQSELKQEQLRSWLLLGGLAATLVVGGFLLMLTRKLRKRNEEKEFLIKEIHHRVKNNLQILSSLLHLQSRQITDDTALSAVREGQNRVDAMGLIHQKLYMGNNVAKVEMKDYLEQFGQNMLDSFGIEDERVRIEYEVAPLYLDVDTAIPLGLIINELVTNSLKYAFPFNHHSLSDESGLEGRSEGDNSAGTIRIALWQNEQNQLCLKVSDNGVGQSNAQKDGKSTSFGTNLVQMLSKKLKGTPEVLPAEEGYATLIVFERWA